CGGVEVRGGVAHSPVEQVQIGIERAGHPGGAAAVAPAFARPGLVAFLPRTRDGVEPPAHVARGGVARSEIATMRGIAALNSGDDRVLYDERSAGDFAAALPGILDVDLPDFLAGSLIERNQVIVGGPEKDAAAAYGNTAVLLSIKRDGFRKGKTILPDEP